MCSPLREAAASLECSRLGQDGKLPRRGRRRVGARAARSRYITEHIVLSKTENCSGRVAGEAVFALREVVTIPKHSHDGGRWAAQPVDLFILWADQPVRKYKSTAITLSANIRTRP